MSAMSLVKRKELGVCWVVFIQKQVEKGWKNIWSLIFIFIHCWLMT